MSMPNKVDVVAVGSTHYVVDKELSVGYLAFAHPGKFVGWGNTMQEALLMARLRYRAAKNNYETKNPDLDWGSYAYDRCNKMEKVYSTKGISKDSTWSIYNVGKTENGA